MRSIDRYILRQLSLGMVLVTLGLTAILWLTQSLRFVELTVNKGASIADFLSLTLLVVPNFLTVILPVSIFAVALFTYDRLIADRELLVLRSAGVSHAALARPALVLALACAAIGFLLNLWLIPLSVHAFHFLQWQMRSSATAVLIREGTFTQIGNGLTVYVRSRTADGELHGIIVDDRRDRERTITLMAERGALIKKPDGTPEVVMFNGTRQQEVRGSDRMSLLHFDNYAMDFGGGGNSGSLQSSDAREQTMGQLLDADTATLGLQQYRQYQVEAHQRLASPLYNVTFTLLACACLLAGSFNRRGQLDRIALGVGAMVALQAMALGISDLAARDLSLIPLIYLGPILPAVAAGWVLLRPGFGQGAALRAGAAA
jgi:lipopolysaccharide export system permease protein